MKRIVVWVGIAISILSLVLVFTQQQIDWGRVGAALQSINYWWLLATIVPYVLTIAGKVYRWRVLLYPDRPRLSKLSNGLLISYLFNIALPARPGEVIRAYYVAETERLSFVRLLSTILVEKVLDILTLVLLLAAVLPFAPLPAALQGPALFLSVLFFILFVVLIVFALRPDFGMRIVGIFTRPLPASIGGKINGLAEQVINGLRPLANPRLTLPLAFWSLFTWITNAATTYTVIMAFDLPVPAITASLLITIAFNLGMSIPTQGGLGVFEYIVTLILQQVFGQQDYSANLSFAFVLHIVGYLPLAIVGFGIMLTEGLSWGRLTSAAQEGKAGDAAPQPVAEGVNRVG